MRKLLNVLLSLYLLPFHWSKRLAIYAKGKILTFDEHYVATIDVAKREFGGTDGIIIDIGAFDGDSTIYFAKAFPTSKVVGFEPNSEPYQQALKNTTSFKNISMNNLGVSHKEGDADFYVTQDAVSSSLHDPTPSSEVVFSKKISIKLTTLDSFFPENTNVLLIKIDVQGAELGVLKSGRRVLRNTRLVLTEMLNADMYSGNCKYYEVDELLRESGFQLYGLFSNYNNDGLKYFDALYINKAFRKA